MHPGPPLIACGRGVRGGLRVPTSDPHTINACWFLFLLFVYLLVAEAASFDKKELCRSDTLTMRIELGLTVRVELGLIVRVEFRFYRES